MPGSAQSEQSLPPDRPDLTVLREGELGAALQLLVERAQYITGATGTALALPQGDEMVCRASAGACAPSVGARLQVRSGLTGESIARRQLLRCDNAETDPRVNLETCRALGIASIVVLPLLRRTGEVRGLFELFSDHPYAFEERDLVALERMAALTITALDLAEEGHDSVAPSVPPARQKEGGPAAGQNAGPPIGATSIAGPKQSPTVIPATPPSPPVSQAELQVASVAADPAVVPAQSKSSPDPEIHSASPAAAPETSTPVNPPGVGSTWSFSAPVISPPIISPPITSAPVTATPVMSAPVIETPPPDRSAVPEAMRRIQKCASCGFPVSEGRTLCLDCESLERLKVESEKKAREKAAREVREIEATAVQSDGVDARTAGQEQDHTTSNETVKEEDDFSGPSAAQAQDEILPPFLTNPQLVEEPWLARHVNLLAFLVLVVAVLVAAVVFFR